MAKRIIAKLAAVFFALIILFASLIETSSIKYAFGARNPQEVRPSPKVAVPYALPHPGTVLPDNPLWGAKVLRDKIELKMERDDLNRAVFELHLSDKRLSTGWEQWEGGDTNNALPTFQKAEGYLSQAYETFKIAAKEDTYIQGDKNEVLRKIVYASLKHREILENVLAQSGDDARPTVTKLLNTSKTLYDQSSAQMDGLGLTPPSNPFK